MSNPIQKSQVFPKAPNRDLKDMDILFTFKIKIESHNLAQGCIKDQCPCPNQVEDAKSQSGTSSPHESPKSGLKGQECSLHPQNEDKEPKFGSWMCQRPLIISKSRSRYQTLVSNLQPPTKLWLWVNERPVIISKSR